MSLEKFTAGTIIAIIGAAIILTVTTAGLLSVNQTVPSSGIVTPTVNLGVYQEYACTHNLTSISWGTLSPGGSATRTIYVKNIGTSPITVTMATANWSPTTANGPITVTWSINDNTLNAGQVATATLTLNVSPSISGITDFSCDIVITGTD